MFYSLLKHRKSVGHQAAQFHENTTVEVIWTIIPFFILVFMAYPATSTILATHDTSSPDMTVKVTGYQWKWNYDYLEDGISYYSNLATPLAQIENREPKGEHYLLEVDNPLVVPVDAKVRVLHHRRRRRARVVGAGLRREAGRHSRLRARLLVPRRQARHLPRPVRRALRQGARLHADRRRGEVEGGLRHVARRAEAEVAGRRRRPEQGVGASPRWSIAATRCSTPTAPPATARPPPAIPRSARRALVGDKVVLGPKDHQIDVVLNGQNNGKMPPWKHAVRRRDRLGDQLHAQQLGQQGRAERRAAVRREGRPQVILVFPDFAAGNRPALPAISRKP